MRTMKPHLSIIIPAYNEERNIGNGLLNSVFGFLSRQKYSWEVIFVDDGSNDGTNRLLRDLVYHRKRFSLIKIAHGGKLAAIRTGMLHAEGKIRLFTDLDQSTPITFVPKMLEKHASGADVVIGVRGKGGRGMLDDTIFRKIRGFIFIKLVQIILLPNIIDSQCGFKSFTAATAVKIFPNLLVTGKKLKLTGGYMGAWDVEALFIAQKLGLKISQVPVDWKKIVSSKLNFWLEPAKMLLNLFEIRILDWVGSYDFLISKK